MGDRRRGGVGRHLVRGVGPLLVVTALLGCSASDDVESVVTTSPGSRSEASTTPSSAAASADSTTSTAPAPSDASSKSAPTSAPTTAAPTTAAPTTPETAPRDAGAMLTEGLDRLAEGYHFVTTVTVGEQTALTAEGDRVGDATRMTVTSDGRAVDYVVTPEATWVAEAGTWQQLDQVAQSSDPLAPLRAPSAAAVGEDGDRTSVLATYPAAALGLGGDGPVDVTIELDDGVVAAMSYADPSAGHAMVRTEFSPLTDPTPVTVPSA